MSRGCLWLELADPIQAPFAAWIVAVYVNTRRPDVTRACVAPVLVPDLEQWQADS